MTGCFFMSKTNHSKVNLQKRVARESAYYPQARKPTYPPSNQSAKWQARRGYTSIKKLEMKDLAILCRQIRPRYAAAGNAFGAAMALNIEKKVFAYGALSPKQLAWIAKAACDLHLRIPKIIERLFYQFCPICRHGIK